MNGSEAWVSWMRLGGHSAARAAIVEAIVDMARAAATSNGGQVRNSKRGARFMRGPFGTPGRDVGRRAGDLPSLGVSLAAGEVQRKVDIVESCRTSWPRPTY